MTEPTAEQVERERTLACGTLCALGLVLIEPDMTVIATALARVRIEAHAAGRDEGLEAALGVAEEFDNDGRFSAWEAAIQICNAIRALRGRT